MSSSTTSQINPIKVGILGGGQLARMLCEEGFKIGLEMHVLCPSPDEPAAQVTRHWHQGDTSSLRDVENFYKSVDIVTLESEFLEQKILLHAEASSGRPTFPTPRLIDEFSDRLKQKTWLESFRIPTASFSGLSTPQDALAFYGKHKRGLVFKKRRFGYDGYGTFILKDKSAITSWLKKNSESLRDYIVEEFTPFHRELALQIAINAKKEILIFPLVEWQAENAKCLWVKGPTRGKGLGPLTMKIVRALKETGYVGLVAFEIFETSKGLVINEVAPRVHNSGHATLEACAVNQFSAHLRAILNWPLPKTPHLQAKGFAMLNLIGQSDGPVYWKVPDKANLHWYGKRENRPGRKMGHITSLATNPNAALREVLRMRKDFQL